MLVSVICAVVCLPMSAACAQDLLIVLSSQAKPYVEAAQACETLLNESGVQTSRVDLSTLSSADINQITDNVIAFGGRASAKLAAELPPTTQLFYAMTPQPIKIGLTKRPNTSGISTETNLKEQIMLIQAGSASIKRIGVLYRSSSANSTATIDAIKGVVPLDWEVVAIDLDAYNSESAGIKNLLKQSIDIVWTLPDPSTYNPSMIKALLLESLRKNVPVFGFSHSLVGAGATFGIGIDPDEQGVQVAKFVLNQKLDVHLPADPQIAINLIAADRIKFDLADAFIRQAEMIFRSN